MTRSQNHVVFLHGNFPFFSQLGPRVGNRARLVRALMQVVTLHFGVGQSQACGANGGFYV